MYMDKFLTYVLATDAAAATTKAIPLANPSLANQVGPLDNPGPKDTSGMAPYCGGRLWFYANAGEAIATGFTLTLEHCDTEDGTFEAFMTYGPTVEDKELGDTVLSAPVPMGIKNFSRFTLSTAAKMNIFLTPDVEKVAAGLRRA